MRFSVNLRLLNKFLIFAKSIQAKRQRDKNGCRHKVMYYAGPCIPYTKLSRYSKHLQGTAVLAAWHFFASCQSPDPKSQLSDLMDDSQQESQNFADEETEEDSDESPARDAHPKQATAWYTRKLVMTSIQPSSESIKRCRERVEATAGQSTNLRALNDAANALEEAVDRHETVFHWCFYQMMVDLDQKLEHEPLLIDEKADLFLSRMRSLWSLAQTLDTVKDSDIYIPYLRTRYKEMNQTLFGRRLERMDMDDFRMKVNAPGKRAADNDD